jgi:hypothetical protein
MPPLVGRFIIKTTSAVVAKGASVDFKADYTLAPIPAAVAGVVKLAQRTLFAAFTAQFDSTVIAKEVRNATALKMRNAIFAVRGKVSGEMYAAAILAIGGNGKTLKAERIVGTLEDSLRRAGMDPRVLSAQLSMFRAVADSMADSAKFTAAVKGNTAMRPLYTATLKKAEPAEVKPAEVKTAGAVPADQARNIAQDWIALHLIDAIAACDAAAKHAADSILLDRLAPAMLLVAERRKASK